MDASLAVLAHVCVHAVLFASIRVYGFYLEEPKGRRDSDLVKSSK